MERWQKQFICKNLPELQEATHCNAQLLASLEAFDILSLSDRDLLNTVYNSKGRLTQSSFLYAISQTKIKGYECLTKALLKCKQSGAAKILLTGLLENGIEKPLSHCNINIPCDEILASDVEISGKVCKLSTIFPKLTVEDLEDILKENHFEKEYLEVFVFKERCLKLTYNTLPDLPPTYITRRISNRVCVKSEFFKQNLEDVFVFVGIDRFKLTGLVSPYGTSVSSDQIAEVTSRFILLEDDVDLEYIRENCQRPINLIRYEKNPERFILEATTHPTSQLAEFIINNSTDQKLYELEDNVMEKIQNDTSSLGVCICNAPGKGKTLMLLSLAIQVKNKFPDRIVIFLSLSQFIKFFDQSKYQNDLSFEDTIKTLLEYISDCRILETILLNELYKGRIKLELFLDGFDEIPEDKVDLGKLFLRSLVNTKNSSVKHQTKVYVTSRPHHRHELETAFKMKAYDILPFSRDQQQNYLTSHWMQMYPRSVESRLQMFAKTCLIHAQESLWDQNRGWGYQDQDKDLLGIPLQCFLLAEVYSNEARAYADPRRHISQDDVPKVVISVFEMYRRFIELTFKDSDKLVKKLHTMKALQAVFPKFAVEFANIEHGQLLESDLNLLRSEILVKRYGSMNQCSEFVHQTFADYLAAEFFAGILSQNVDSIWRGWQPTKKTVQFIIYTVLDCESCLPVEYYLDVPYCKMDRLSYRRSFPRNIYSFKHPIVVYFLNNLLKDAQTKVLSGLVSSAFSRLLSPQGLLDIMHSCLCKKHRFLFRYFRILLETAESKARLKFKFHFMSFDKGFLSSEIYPDNVTKLLNAAAANCGIEMTEECDKLFECFDTDVETVSETMGDFKTPIHWAIEKADYSLVEYYADKISLDYRKIIYYCARHTYGDASKVINTRKDIIKLLLSKNINILKEPMGPCPSHHIHRLFGTLNRGNKRACVITAPKIHLDILKLLIDSGADIFTKKGDTNVITKAATYMEANDYHDLITMLIQEKKAFELFKPVCKRSLLPLHDVLQSGAKLFPETVRLILGIPKVHFTKKKKLQNGFLLSAVKGNQPISIVKELIYLGSSVKVMNKLRRGVLHYAAMHGNASLILYLDKYDLSYNDPDIYGNTPLLLASRHFESIKLLVGKGADIFATNTQGNTIVHEVFQRNFACFDLLKDFLNFVLKECKASKLFSVKNSAGQIPLVVLLERRDFVVERSFDMIESILKIKGVNANEIDFEGNNAVMNAVAKGCSTKILTLLIDNGAKYDFCNCNGENILHLAARNANFEAVQHFLLLGLDQHHRNANGKTPLDLAKGYNTFCEDSATLKAIKNIIGLLSETQTVDS